MERLTQSELWELLHCDPINGLLWWKFRERKWFKTLNGHAVWNARLAGKRAFSNVDENGYHRGKILNWDYKAHQVIWCMMYGYYPEIIDHDDGIRTDNRLCNLRDASYEINNRNAAKCSNNTSGVTGVVLHKGTGLWWARISHAGKRINLGMYRSFDVAKAVRLVAEVSYGYHRNHGKRA